MNPRNYLLAAAVLVAVLLLALTLRGSDPQAGGIHFGDSFLNSSSSVATSAVQIFAAQAYPSCRKITNDSANRIYCAVNATATLNSGLRINPPGQTTSSEPTVLTFGCEESEPRPERITCIAADAASVVNLYGY